MAVRLTRGDARRHEANKREAFDGMRAYHNSEIAHKAHTVEVIKTILTLVVGAYGGLIALLLKQEVTPSGVRISSGLLLLVTLCVVGYVVYKTNAKVDSDHRSYEANRSEYLAERKLLDLDSSFSALGYNTHWVARPFDAPSGYSYTKRLTVALGAIVAMTAVFGSILSVAASLTQQRESNPAGGSAIGDSILPALAAVRAADPLTMNWTMYSLEPENDRKESKVVLIREGRDDGYAVLSRKDTRTILSLQPTTILQQRTTVVGMAIWEIQGRLHLSGYYAGAIDGMMGPLTSRALRRFQQTSGLAVTGEPDTGTLRLLAKYPTR